MEITAPKTQQSTLVFEHIHGFCQTVNEMGWDVEFSPLGDGEPTTASVFSSEHTTVLKGCFGNPLVQRGYTPENKITFGLTPDILEPIPWNNYSVDNKQLIPFGQGDEFESISQKDFQCITISFDATFIQILADRLGVHSNKTLTENDSPLILDAGVHQELLNIIGKIQHHSPASLLDEELATTLLLGLEKSGQSCKQISIPRREKLRKAAVDYITQNLEEPIAIKQLSQHCASSWKTLERAFKEYYQLTPKQYISSMRLQATYKELSSAEPGAKVNEIASRWGYWHMGDFAREFKQQYGCLPSSVLRSKR